MELVIVVAIVGILAAIAIPGYINYSAKAQQSEAKMQLGAIFTLMVTYSDGLTSTGYAGATIDNIGFLTTGTRRYSYALSGVTSTLFIATATGTTGLVVNDLWTMDQNKNLVDVVTGDFHN